MIFTLVFLAMFYLAFFLLLPFSLYLFWKKRTLKVDMAFAPRKGTPTARSLLGELYLPLDGLVDVEAEKARLGKQLEKIEKEITKVNAKLNNPNFVKKVPEEVLQESRDRLVDWQVKDQQTREALEYLSES